MPRNFTVWDLTKPTNMSSFRRYLCGRRGERQDTAGRQLCALLEGVCNTAVVEYGYQDFDWTASYVRFHHRHFRDAGIPCERVHFFGKQIDSDERRALPARISPALAKSYLGFTVVRPLPQQVLGRSVISERLLKRVIPRGEVGFLTCSTWYRTHLAGNELQLCGCPWMQQDAHVSACATAALWVASYHMAHRFPHDFRRFSTAEITDLAHRTFSPFGRAMPSGGLSPEQILHALSLMGFAPLLFLGESADDVGRQVYHYVESGLPVILLLGDPDDPAAVGHALTVVGHTLLDSPATQPDDDAVSLPQGNHGIGLSWASDLVPSFILQDDVHGPFVTASFYDNEIDEQERLGSDTATDENGSDERECFVMLTDNIGSMVEYRLLGCAVPLPEIVGLTGVDAENRAAGFLYVLFSSEEAPHFLLRTSLQKANDLKSLWSDKPGRPNDVKRRLKCHNLPRWIWVTEVADYDEWRSDRSIHGFLLQDSSGLAALEGFQDIVAFQLGSALTLIDRRGGAQLARVSNHRYPSLTRHRGQR